MHISETVHSISTKIGIIHLETMPKMNIRIKNFSILIKSRDRELLPHFSSDQSKFFRGSVSRQYATFLFLTLFDPRYFLLSGFSKNRFFTSKNLVKKANFAIFGPTDLNLGLK